MEKKDASSKELENSLVLNWKELDRIMYCNKLPNCVKHYEKGFLVDNKMMKANVVQSMRIILNEIKLVTARIKNIKRYCIGHFKLFLQIILSENSGEVILSKAKELKHSDKILMFPYINP